MRKISIITLIFSVIVSSFSIANEVNVFNARHYKADSELYSKFTNMTGIKVNLINGKSGACLLYTSPSPRDEQSSRMPSSA